jgi:hypothetical protein
LIEVFLAGEGRNELGGWYDEPAYRDERPLPGVLESIARRLVPSGWEVHDAIQWKNIPKLAIGAKGKGVERKNVLVAHLYARERDCKVLLFSRDRDGRKNDLREREIEDALSELEADDGGVAVAGGVCIERLESWLLALSGRAGTEALRDNKVDDELVALGVPAKDTARMLALVERHGLDVVASDASSLRAWLGRAKAVLASGRGRTDDVRSGEHDQ